MRIRDIGKDARRQAHAAIEEYQMALAGATTADELEEYRDSNGFVTVCVGTVFDMMPSGKYYMPWAHSNLKFCPRCLGQGCAFCGQTGSREAYEDKCWWQAFEAELGKAGYWARSGEGNSCDIFVGAGPSSLEESVV